MADGRIESIKINGNDKSSTLYSAENMKLGNDVSLGAYYLSTRPDLYEPQRGNTFMFQVDFPDGFFDNDDILAQQNPNTLANYKDILRVAVSSAFVPHFSNETIAIQRGNSTVKFAGKPTYRDGSVKITDFIGAGSKDLAMAWQRKVYNVDTEKLGLAIDYKVTGKLIEYTPDYQPLRTWVLYGCWISGLSEDDYNHESPEKREIDCQIQYDKAVIDPPASL